MEKEILKNIVKYLFLLILFVSCKKISSESDIASEKKVDQAIKLVEENKSIKDTIIKLRQQLGVEFLPCIITGDRDYSSLSFQIVQSKVDKSPPFKIDHYFKIKNFENVDILFIYIQKRDEKKYDVKIDDKLKKLIRKGYITVYGPKSIVEKDFVEFVFCEKNRKNFKVFSQKFYFEKEAEADKNDLPFIIENYFPKCN